MPKKHSKICCYEGIIIILKDCASVLSLHIESSQCDYIYVTSYFTLCICKYIQYSEVMCLIYRLTYVVVAHVVQVNLGKKSIAR